MRDSIFFYIGLYIVVVILPTVIVISKAVRSKKKQPQVKTVKKQPQVKAKKINFEELFEVKKLEEEVARKPKKTQVKVQKIDFEKLFEVKKPQKKEATIESTVFSPNYYEYSMDNSQAQEVAKVKSQNNNPIQKTEQIQTQEKSKVKDVSLNKKELSEAQKLILYTEIMNRKYA